MNYLQAGDALDYSTGRLNHVDSSDMQTSHKSYPHNPHNAHHYQAYPDRLSEE